MGIRNIIRRLEQFKEDYKKWDTEEFSQADMVTELKGIIKDLEEVS